LVKISLDNKSIDDDRVADEEALRDILSGKRREHYIASKIKAVQIINHEFLKKKFPDIMPDYYDVMESEVSDNPENKHWAFETPKHINKCNEILLKVGDTLAIKRPKIEPKAIMVPESYMKAIEKNSNVSKLEELKALRKLFFITRKKLKKCIDWQSLFSKIQLYEAEVSFELTVNAIKKDLANTEPKIVARAEKIFNKFKKMKAELNTVGNLSDNAMKGFKSLISNLIERDNPILKKYYDDLEKAKEEKKVIPFKKATA
jgi:hypothetical protein